MEFRDGDGKPLIGWTDAASAYQAWQRCSAGRPCDYTALTYERLRGTVYRFHTRTKTGRTPELDAAAPARLGRAAPGRRRRPRHH